MQQVHLRVTDAATAKPTPVRVRVTDATGAYYAPFGRLTHFPLGPQEAVGGNVHLDGKAWAYIDGGCEILVPPGPLRVQIEKGPEYRPLDEQVQLGAGKLSLRFTIERWIDLRQEGWYSGDTRVQFIAPHAAHLEAQAEDVALANLLIRQTTQSYSTGDKLPTVANLDAFSGEAACLRCKPPGLQARDYLVAVNTENSHPELGNLGLLNCHRVVYPLTFGGPGGQEDWTFGDWCGQCHRKAGLVVWTRTLHQTEDFQFGAPLIETLLGEVDAFELTELTLAALPLWYDLLNLGVTRFPLAGASGKDSNATALGSLRTYVHLNPGEDFSTNWWIHGVRTGASYVTNGPLVTFTVDGFAPSSLLLRGESFSRPGRVLVRAEAKSLRPFERLEVVCNGTVVAAADGAGQPVQAALEADIPLERSAWLAARCTGGAFAHTSPIYAQLEGPALADRAAAARLLHEVDRMIAWCPTKARCPTPQAFERLMLGFVRARKILERKSR